jgi:hypothetical protein
MNYLKNQLVHILFLCLFFSCAKNQNDYKHLTTRLEVLKQLGSPTREEIHPENSQISYLRYDQNNEVIFQIEDEKVTSLQQGPSNEQENHIVYWKNKWQTNGYKENRINNDLEIDQLPHFHQNSYAYLISRKVTPEGFQEKILFNFKTGQVLKRLLYRTPENL